MSGAIQRKPCRRCLLREADEGQLYEIIRQRIAALPSGQRASAEEYERRLAVCVRCAELVGGTCRKCGCYVELRAAKKSAVCPHEHCLW